MKQHFYSIFVLLGSLLVIAGCTTRHLHTHEVVTVPNKPFEAVREASQCFTDRATFVGDKELKPAFADSAAREIVTRLKMASYTTEQESCITVAGTGRAVVVYMCPNGSRIKDHYCYPN